MKALGRSLVALLLLGVAALAASGIEVLSHTPVRNGIEVLCAADGGTALEASLLIDGSWVQVDEARVEGGLAAVVFPGLAAGEARLVLRDAQGAVVDGLAYSGDGAWGRP
jgi:hypothetical protein